MLEVDREGGGARALPPLGPRAGGRERGVRACVSARTPKRNSSHKESDSDSASAANPASTLSRARTKAAAAPPMIAPESSVRRMSSH